MHQLRSLPTLNPLEWLALSTRLLWLAALLLVAGLSVQLTVWTMLVILFWAGYSVAIALAIAEGWGNEWLRWGGAILDMLLGLLLIAISGFFSSPLWSSLLIGALGAGLSFGLIGAITMTALSLVAAAILGVILTHAGLWLLAPLGMYVGALMLAASVIGQLAEQLRWLAPLGTFASMSRIDGERQRQRLRAIFPMVAELNATLNYERVLDMVLEVSASALSDFQPEEDKLVGALMMYDGDQLRLLSGRRLTHADMRVTVPGDRGLLGDAFATGDPRLGRNPVNDVEIQRLVGFHACRQALAIPLSAGLETYGILLFGHPEVDYFNSERIDLLEAVAQQAMVALQNAKLYRDLEQEKERIMEIEEEARNSLARDLHDGPTQSIAAIAMRVNFALRLFEKDEEAAFKELKKVEDLARRTTKEIRHMLFTLRPLILESQGLVMALKQLAEKVKETHDQNVVVEAEKDVAGNLDMGKQGVVFYIVDEAVNNAVKHAEAQNVWVRLRSQADLFILEIEDDGVGFNVGSVDSDYAQRGSLGMVNMRERTELVNGVLNIESAIGAGTLITVTVPETEERAEELHRAGGVR
ncbi:MAG: GAF domain-containing sensor histidine kinase [Chloroflexi bacterium]|nr:GAF domain-containing sensor histidine kinase [Chloroflexota bacterium]